MAKKKSAPAVKGLLGRKLGMTQLFNPDGTLSAVTVVEAGPCRVLDLRTEEKDGYAAARLAFDPVPARRLSKPLAGEFKKAGIEPARQVIELRGAEGLQAGEELRCDVFAEGELVDVTAKSKGKGFQGMVKRHRFSRGPESHGSMNVRQPGSIGATDAARVFKGVKMAGHMGAARTTVQGVKVLRVDHDRNLLLLHGSVPGAYGSLVLIRGSVKQRAGR
ncbi:MAG: 50S ribosomal protein L3 [Candidatus Dormibacteraeota bacterium]|uniref:50S ribosomal protein L3 n=1 Tax=Candidatus Dormibacter sp. TaxID=2973982 RepID=UPI000DB65C18|nr:50S ribosomal protein L3 [Candidatus Dormibacteraeota bacterium]PZR66890.1 MAG: 50S ribosomal protein L3 [Candidatus Dormibacteraeota bacterium]